MPLDLLFSEPPPENPKLVLFGDEPEPPSTNPLDLVFSETPVPAGPVKLVFGGEEGSPSIPDVEVYGASTISGGRWVFSTSQAVKVSSQTSITGLRTAGSVVFDVNVLRLTTADAKAGWEKANALENGRADAWQTTEPKRVARAATWQVGAQASGNFAERIGALEVFSESSSAPWEEGVNLSSKDYSESFGQLDVFFKPAVTPWSEAAGLVGRFGSRYKVLFPLNHRLESGWDLGAPVSILSGLLAGAALPTAVFGRVVWQDARKPPPGRMAPPVIVDPELPGYTPSTDLLFQCPFVIHNGLAVPLVFAAHPCEGESEPSIVERKVYIIVNELSMKRVDDNTPIELVSASVGIDKSSWCWSFSGAVPYYEFEKIEPGATGPVEVELNINGLLWRLLIEKYNTKELFAKTDVSISGRSVTAWLDDPYAPVRSYSQDATIGSRALAEAELTRAGLVTGFELDWQLIDPLGWLIPANSWSYTDLTPMQVIKAIAEGVGGYVNSHPYEKKVLVRSEYPVPFWEWDAATLDHTIPDALVLARSLDWEERPIYNGVYVSGENTGVNDFIRRMGTDGGMQAQMYINPMITDHAASRHKGIQILSASGKQARVGLDLPMEPALGLVTPGMLIRVQKDAATGWRGLVSSTQINADWGDSLTVVQSIELERHYGGL